MVAQIRLDAADLAIVRIPTSRSDLILELSKLCGEMIFGDCLVIYARDNKQMGFPPALRNNLVLREAGESDFDLVDSLTEDIFSTYRNHYANNPRLGSFQLIDGYKEWARSHVSQPGKKCFIAEINREPCAYSVVRMGDQETEGVLLGVVSTFRRRGIYRDLVRETLNAFIRAGSPVTTISTQVENVVVQRVWASEGFMLTKSFYTLHLNDVGKSRGKR
jgi:ribosomal protein S18 acetylase RimI-like enzyme